MDDEPQAEENNEEEVLEKPKVEENFHKSVSDGELNEEQEVDANENDEDLDDYWEWMIDCNIDLLEFFN